MKCMQCIIITLFQANNIFDTSASLTYGPQLQRVSFVIGKLKYVQSRWCLCIPSMLRAGYPTLLTGGGGIVFQAQDQQVTRRSSR